MSRFHEGTLKSKNSNHFKNIKTRLKNDPFDHSSINHIFYFTSKYLKQTFDKESNEIRSIKYGPGMMYLSDTVQYFAFKYLKRTFGK